MAELTRATVAMLFSDGSKITSWDQATLRSTFTDPLDELAFVAAPPRDQWPEYRQRLAKGNAVTVEINGVTQGNFIIQTVKRSTSREGGMAIAVTCHTPLVTPYQGGVDPDIAVYTTADASVGNFVKQVLEPYGFTEISGDSVLSTSILTGQAIRGPKELVAIPTLKFREATAHDGESAYSFLSRILTRLGVVVRMATTQNGTTALLVCAPNYDQDAIATVYQTFGARIPDADPFIGAVIVTDSNDDQFSEVIVRGQRPDDAGTTQTNRPVATAVAAQLRPERPFYTSDVAPYKPRWIKDKWSRDVQKCGAFAELALTMNAASSYAIDGTVDGWVSRTGALWTVDTIVHTILESENLFANIPVAGSAAPFGEDMWVMSRTFVLSREGGQTTQLKLLPKCSLQLGQIGA